MIHSPSGVSLAPKITTASSRDLLPNGHKVKGMNLNSPWMTSTSYSWIADLWSYWNTQGGAGGGFVGGSWTGYFKPAIDEAAALGCNVVRFFTTAYGRYPAPGYTQIPWSTYAQRIDQLAAYVASKGMYLYPCLPGDPAMGLTGVDNTYNYTPPPISWYVAEGIALCQLLEKWISIIPGIDIANETVKRWANLGTPLNGLAPYQALKAAVPRFQYTYSSEAWNGSPGNPPTYGLNQCTWADATICDFVDIHIYYDASASDVDGLIQSFDNAGKTRPILIGETGQNMAAGTAARQSRATALKNVANNVTLGRYAAGVEWWALTPQDTVGGSNDWGICDASLNPRSDVASIWSGFPN